MIDTAYRSVDVEEVDPGWLVDLGDDGVLVVARVLKLAEGIELYGSTTRQPSRKRTVVFKRHQVVSVFADEGTLDAIEGEVLDDLLGGDAGHRTLMAIEVKGEAGTDNLAATVAGVKWWIPLRPHLTPAALAKHWPQLNRARRAQGGSNWHGPKPVAVASADEVRGILG